MKPVDEAYIRKIISNSLFLDERRKGKAFSMTVGECSQERLSSWQKLLNVTPHKNIFEIRLAGDGITEEEALRICGEPSFLSKKELPSWTDLLKEALQLLPMKEEEVWREVYVIKSEIELVGPLGALLPFVAVAERRMKEKYMELPLIDLSDILFRRLYYTCAQTFNAQLRMKAFMGKVSLEDSGAAWEKLAESLLQGEWIDLLEEYPVLARRIGTTIEYFLDFTEEALDRFYERKSAIEADFFNGDPIHKIVNVTGEISDLHQKGKSVLILVFDGNRKLVYKPRSLEIDVAWEEFLAYFKTEKSSVKAPHAVDYGDYGFIEFIEHKPCQSRSELETHFYNAGSLMALLFSFGGNDFHMENIIACGSTPVIIDTETLMIPVARYFGKGGKDDPEDEERKKNEESLEDVIERSVIKMGLLPMWQKDGENKRADYGGLTGDKEDMANLPVYEGKRYPGNEFAEEVASGFRDMYRQIMRRREELLDGEKGIRLFEHCRFRMLIRSSQVYGNLLRHIIQPSFLKNGFDYSMTTDRLVNAFLYDAHESIISELMKVFYSEKRAVERGDIPIFYGEPGGEGILDEQGLLFDRYFEKSALANARERISKFSEEDLMIQLQIIEKSLAAEARSVHEYLSKSAEESEYEQEKQALLTKEELLKEAETIYEEIMENRLVAKNGDYSWLAEQYDLTRSGTSLSIMGPFLYDGILGIAVYAAALYVITKNEDCYKTANHCIDKAGDYLKAIIPNMERYKMNLGYSSGLAGCIAGCALVSEYLEQETGYALGEQIVLGITENMIKDDTVFDVLGGVSGLILALTKDNRWLSHEKTKKHVLDILNWCGMHLLEQRTVETGLGFKVLNSKEATQPLTGLGHGAAGIAMALFRLFSVFRDEKYLQAGEEAVLYERSVFDREAVNWPDFRKDPSVTEPSSKKFMGGYCAGAPGIGLARLDGLQRISGLADAADTQELIDILMKDVRHADRFVRSIRNEGRNHLCCGSAGRVDFLIQAAFQLNDREAEETAHRTLSGLIQGKRERGHYNFHTANGKYYYNPTLFQGTAGVGYEMLRLLEPEKIKSILI